MTFLKTRKMLAGPRLLAALLACPGGAGLASAADYEWTFSQGNLNPALGNGLLEYADGATTQGLTTFGTTDGVTVPHINGQAAAFLRVPAFTEMGNGYNLTLSGTGPNGGGAYVNQYTFVFDVLSPDSLNWAPFFNTNPDNANDADFYIAPDGAIGTTPGYSSAGLVAPDTWYRIAFTADLAAGTLSYYLNGALAQQVTQDGLLEGRWSLYSNADAGHDVRLFNEGDISGDYTHELYVSSFFATDRAMSAGEIGLLGGPNALGVAVPEPGTWALLGLGLLTFACWRRSRKV